MVLNKQNLISEGKEVLITMENDDDDCDADSDLTEEFDCEEYNNSHKKNQNEYESLENGLGRDCIWMFSNKFGIFILFFSFLNRSTISKI